MLKKILVILLCVFLCSCSHSAESEISIFFQREKIYFEYSEITYEFNPKSESFIALNGEYKGMSVSFGTQGCVVNCNEFCIKTETNSFPPLKGFYSLYNAFKNNPSSVVSTDDGAYALLIDSSRFLVYYNTDNKKTEKLIAETADGVFEYTVNASEETD